MGKVNRDIGSGAKAIAGYKVAGQAWDGVLIIKPTARPTHFSVAQASETIRKILRESTTGKIVAAKRK